MTTTLAASNSVLSVVGSLLLLQAFIVSVHGALAPGYEDHWWCPSASYCKRPLNPGPDFAGPQSAFYDCYDPVTATSAQAVWTGSLSDTDEPEGWVLDPGLCTRTEAVPTGACPGRTEVIVVSDPCDVVSDVVCGAYQCSAAGKWVRVTVDKAASSDATTVAAADIMVANNIEEASAAAVGTTMAAAAVSFVAAAAVGSMVLIL